MSENVKRRLRQYAPESCFVITPIDADGSPVREHTDKLLDEIIEPVLRRRQFVVQVSHRMHAAVPIPQEILGHLRTDPLVVANLTGLNSNVLYELGYRHAIGRPTVMIASDETKLPFDIAPTRVLFYDRTMKDGRNLRKRLSRSVDASLRGGQYARGRGSGRQEERTPKIAWDRVGSLFWLASELRKLRLFFDPEVPTDDRVIDGLVQALHHARRLKFNQYVTREIERALKDVRSRGFEGLNSELRTHHADRLRIAMNNAAGTAEQVERGFQPGPRAAHPAARSSQQINGDSNQASKESAVLPRGFRRPRH